MSRAAHWECISGCGACCRLDPGQRPEALEALSEEQRHAYLALVGADGWCIHYDTGGRRCRIYADRPDFCRVENLVRLFFAGASAAGEGPRKQTADHRRPMPWRSPAAVSRFAASTEGAAGRCDASSR